MRHKGQFAASFLLRLSLLGCCAAAELLAASGSGGGGASAEPSSRQSYQKNTAPPAGANFEAAFQGECGSKRNGAANASPTNPCEHICLDLHDGTYECACSYGFALAVDGYSCSKSVSSQRPQLPQPAASWRRRRPELGAAAEPPPPQAAFPTSKDERRRANEAAAAAAGDKWSLTRYETIASEANVSAAAASSSAAAAAASEQEPSVRLGADEEAAEDEQPDEEDRDVGLMMRQNDRLLERLQDSIEGNERARRRRSDPTPSPPDSNLSLLEFLVGKTIDDHAAGAAGAGSPRAAPGEPPREFNGATWTVAAAAAPQIGTRAKNRSSSARADWLGADFSRGQTSGRAPPNDAGPVDGGGEIGAPRLARAEPTGAGDADAEHATSWRRPAPQTESPMSQRRPDLCATRPECESGGECAVEQVAVAGSWAQVASVARCRCPIGRGGQFCQKSVQRAEPQFFGGSYLALPMRAERRLENLKLVFKPLDEGGPFGREVGPPRRRPPTRARVLLYSASFALLLDDMMRLEFRYWPSAELSSKLVRVMGSRDALPGEWNELLLTDASSDDTLEVTVDGEPSRAAAKPARIVIVVPDKVGLKPSNSSRPTSGSGELFAGGLPETTRQHALESKIRLLDEQHLSLAGFTGCIKELTVNSRAYKLRSDLSGDALDGFDLGECTL